MPRGQTGTGTMTRARSGTLHNQQHPSMSGSFKLLFDVGPYGVYWVNNKQIAVFKLGANSQPVAVNRDQSCADIWNVFEQTLTHLHSLPIQNISALLGSASVGQIESTSSVASTSRAVASGGNTTGGSIDRTAVRRGGRTSISRTQTPALATSGSTNNSS